MAKLQLQTVQKELLRLNLHFKEGGRSVEEILILSEDYFDDCKARLSDELFIAAVKESRRECKFFPKVSDIYSRALAMESYFNLPKRQDTNLLEHKNELTEAERMRNKKRIGRMISGIFDEGKTPEQVIEEIEKVR